MPAGATHPDAAAVENTLKSVGFTDVMISSPVGSLSGGWKMKLALGKLSSCMSVYLSLLRHGMSCYVMAACTSLLRLPTMAGPHAFRHLALFPQVSAAGNLSESIATS